jgi:hypothetical protein
MTTRRSLKLRGVCTCFKRSAMNWHGHSWILWTMSTIAILCTTTCHPKTSCCISHRTPRIKSALAFAIGPWLGISMTWTLVENEGFYDCRNDWVWVVEDRLRLWQDSAPTVVQQSLWTSRSLVVQCIGQFIDFPTWKFIYCSGWCVRWRVRGTWLSRCVSSLRGIYAVTWSFPPLTSSFPPLWRV